MIKKVRKLPLIVEAVQFTGTKENEEFLINWSNSQTWRCSVNENMLKVKCLEALAETPIGSYVVKGIKGEVWPIREDIFDETYEVVGDL